MAESEHSRREAVDRTREPVRPPEPDQGIQHTEPISKRGVNGHRVNGAPANAPLVNGTPVTSPAAKQAPGGQAPGKPAKVNGTPVNGSRVNGKPVPRDNRTEPIRRKPPVPEVPALPEVAPADPEFWFGAPLAEEPPPWVPEAPAAEHRAPGYTRPGGSQPPPRVGDVPRGPGEHHSGMVPIDDTDETIPVSRPTHSPTRTDPPPPRLPGGSRSDLPVVGPQRRPDSQSRSDLPVAGQSSRHDMPPVTPQPRPEMPSRSDLPSLPAVVPTPPPRTKAPVGPSVQISELVEPPDWEVEEAEEAAKAKPAADVPDVDLTALIPRVRARAQEIPVKGSRRRRVKTDERPKGGRHRRPPRRQPLWREILTLVGVALLLTFLIQHFIGRVYSIPSGSMEQTLHGCPGCSGDRVFVDKVVYVFRDPTPGDVVVFKGPNTWTEHDAATEDTGNAFTRAFRYAGSFIGIAPPDERDFVKRVIAVGGQTVECCDEQNRVLVDGKPLDEPYIYWENGNPNSQKDFARVTVPEGTLWVMGDNRNNSSDSRFQGGGGVRGVVPLGKVIGKARYIVLPPSRWRGIGDHNPQAGPQLSATGWQQGVPLGVGLAVAWPVLWLSRRVKDALTPRKAE
ncbi:signal peptidase I [Actinokineospora terrae]|uniref:Signal peptidase I n=1 Tax=Actinokineospora terrae TaxID=155974 RepID=A0A1H9QBB8_9PSEU|nr:signal peptidase I [Actinokineospora terrae]